jgi:alkanesulfonate monooxygenase SsuD/methylene tetrahydromethanopterin reductase-like flavin-dependent oxidoreductase (luciferase family)
VSWHEPEYEALGVPFRTRGARLDEHLAAWALLWRETPATFEGRYYGFEDVYFEPKAYLPEGPRLWFGGSSLHERLLRRLVAYGTGFHPLGQPTDEELARLSTVMAEAGRDADELEWVGGVRGTYPDATSVAPLEPALEQIPRQLERGFTSICIKPSQFLDDRSGHAAWCRDVVARVGALVG